MAGDVPMVGVSASWPIADWHKVQRRLSSSAAGCVLAVASSKGWSSSHGRLLHVL